MTSPYVHLPSVNSVPSHTLCQVLLSVVRAWCVSGDLLSGPVFGAAFGAVAVGAAKAPCGLGRLSAVFLSGQPLSDCCDLSAIHSRPLRCGNVFNFSFGGRPRRGFCQLVGPASWLQPSPARPAPGVSLRCLPRALGHLLTCAFLPALTLRSFFLPLSSLPLLSTDGPTLRGPLGQLWQVNFCGWGSPDVEPVRPVLPGPWDVCSEVPGFFPWSMQCRLLLESCSPLSATGTFLS